MPELGGGVYPTALIVGRNGNVSRTIPGHPFLWKWTFLPDGKRLAYEAGPLHCCSTFHLVELSTGRDLERYYGDQDPHPDRVPAWVEYLDRNPNP